MAVDKSTLAVGNQKDRRGAVIRMWQYEKKLQYPISIKSPNAKMAKIISSQYGGANCKKILNIVTFLSYKAIHYTTFLS